MTNIRCDPFETTKLGIFRMNISSSNVCIEFKVFFGISGQSFREMEILMVKSKMTEILT